MLSAPHAHCSVNMLLCCVSCRGVSVTPSNNKLQQAAKWARRVLESQGATSEFLHTCWVIGRCVKRPGLNNRVCLKRGSWCGSVCVSGGGGGGQGGREGRIGTMEAGDERGSGAGWEGGGFKGVI